MTHKKDTTNKPLFFLLLLSLLFYGGMLFLSAFADDIHYARLPRVTAETPKKQSFSYTITLNNGASSSQTNLFPALPKDMVDSGQVFIVRTSVQDDFTSYYAQKVSIVIDTEKKNDDYYAITDGIFSRDLVILTGYEALSDGDEVALLKEKKEASKVQTDTLFQK